MINKKTYYKGESRITEIRVFGILLYKEIHECFFSEMEALRAQ